MPWPEAVPVALPDAESVALSDAEPSTTVRVAFSDAEPSTTMVAARVVSFFFSGRCVNLVRDHDSSSDGRRLG